MPGNPHGRKRGHAVLTRKDLTKNTQRTRAAEKLFFFVLDFLFVSVFNFLLLKKAFAGGFLSQSYHHQQ